MSTLATNTSLSTFLPVGFEAGERSLLQKKTAALKHIAGCERLIAVGPASRLEVRPKPETISTGIPELDTLTGGIPRGCLTEICGAPSSGKTSVLLATIASATKREEACVLIDACDSFYPSSAAAAGVEFNKLLWVRCGAPPLCAGVCPERSRRVPSVAHKSTNHKGHGVTQRKTGERKLEQVLKTTDLILQSGGFGLVALDLAGIPEKFVRRIPLASWFRFQRAVEHTKTALLVISEFPRALTCAALVVKVWNRPAGISHQSSGNPTHVEILKEIRVEAELVRSRLERKPAQSVKTSFITQAVRAE